MKFPSLVAIAFYLLIPILAQSGELVFDFEDGLDGWQVTEGAFEKIQTTRTDFFHNQGPVNNHKAGFLSTIDTKSGKPSDQQRGVVESPVFTLEAQDITFLIGGGKHTETYLGICTLDGKLQNFATGNNAQKMRSTTFKMNRLIGKKVYLQLVDDHTGGWGHITLDHVRLHGTIDEAATAEHRKKNRKAVLGTKAAAPAAQQYSKSGIKHSFLTTGTWTAIIGENNEVLWQTKGASRDGTVLANGNVLVAFAREVKELTREGKLVWHYQLSKENKEISTAWRLENGNTLITELGAKPRLLEVAADGTSIAVEVPLQPETTNAHMQTRMARKLPNGNYLVPHLLAFAIKEYDATGKVVNVLRTDIEEIGGRKAENWPFTAIRLKNGNTVSCLTHGNKVVEFDPEGNVVWQCSNETANGLFKDPCGGQVLPNGNVVIVPHAERKATGIKLFEVNRDQQVVWKYVDPRNRSTHGIHILTTNGKPVTPTMK